MITFDTMIVYTEKYSERLSFVLKVLSGHLTMDFEQHLELSQLKEGDTFINYSTSYKEDGLWIIPEGLLFENDLRKAAVPYSKELRHIFPSSDPKAYPFDILSAIFYMLSRYEEYLPFEGDMHGRFSASDSMMNKLNSLRSPLVDRWIADLGSILRSSYQQFPSPTSFRYIPTVDVDIAFAYRHRPLWLSLAHYLKALSKADFSAIKTRFKTNVGLQEDPYNTFDILKTSYQKHHPILFFQVGGRGEYDKNLSPFHPEMQKLIHSSKQWADIGIHPSYASNSNLQKLPEEKQVLQQICNKEITKSRQHFLKLSFPASYQALLKNGILEDYTLGFADGIGFRAGTSHPFPFYDLEHERTTTLTLFPLSIMDVSLKNYLKLNPEEAKLVIREIISEIKDVNGTFVSLWHNTSFSEIDDWTEWKEVFYFIHNEATKE